MAANEWAQSRAGDARSAISPDLFGARVAAVYLGALQAFASPSQPWVISQDEARQVCGLEAKTDGPQAPAPASTSAPADPSRPPCSGGMPPETPSGDTPES